MIMRLEISHLSQKFGMENKLPTEDKAKQIFRR